MTYGSNDKGEAYLRLSPEEHKEFQAGKTIKKITGCAKGMYRITIRMTRIKE